MCQDSGYPNPKLYQNSDQRSQATIKQNHISLSLVLFISGILSDSGGISHMMMLFQLQMLWLEVVLATVIPCLKVSLLSIL